MSENWSSGVRSALHIPETLLRHLIRHGFWRPLRGYDNSCHSGLSGIIHWMTPDRRFDSRRASLAGMTTFIKLSCWTCCNLIIIPWKTLGDAWDWKDTFPLCKSRVGSFPRGMKGDFVIKLLIQKSPLTPVRNAFLNNGAGPLHQWGALKSLRCLAPVSVILGKIDH